MKTYWYAVMQDREDTDWGYGSFDLEEAQRMARSYPDSYIAVIDANYDDEEPTTDPVCVGEIETAWYAVYLVGGERDGEELAKFGSETEAVDFARQYSRDHEADFDPVCGGVAIEDPYGETVIDW